MKRLAPLFAATAFALSGGALADTADGKQSTEESAKPSPEAATKQPHGFVVLQRNIYVPVDADGKVASENWIVVEQQGFVSAEEVNAAHAESGMSAPGASDQGHGNAESAEQAPKVQELPAAPSPRAVPSLKDGTPILRGPHIKA